LNSRGRFSLSVPRATTARRAPPAPSRERKAPGSAQRGRGLALREGGSVVPPCILRGVFGRPSWPEPSSRAQFPLRSWRGSSRLSPLVAGVLLRKLRWRGVWGGGPPGHYLDATPVEAKSGQNLVFPLKKGRVSLCGKRGLDLHRGRKFVSVRGGPHPTPPFLREIGR
jgi:hypothetical protein